MNQNTTYEASKASRKKYRVLFIHPGAVPPDRDPRKNLYYHISGICDGDLVSTQWGRRRDCGGKSLGELYDTLGSFRYHATLSVRMPKPFKMFWDLLYYLRMGLGLSRSGGRYDAIVCYGPFKCAMAGWIISRLTGAKLVIMIPGPPTGGYAFAPGILNKIKSRVARIYVPWMLKSADALQLLFPDQIDELLPGNYPPTFVFPDFAAVSAVESWAGGGTEQDGRYALFLGHPFERKGVDVLLKAFQLVSPRHTDFSLKIVGYCPDLSPYRKLAEGYPGIEFLPGQSHEKAMELMVNCTFFVLPSRAEGVPRVLMEAMAAKKPIIATRIHGIPYLVGEGLQELLVERDDVEGLASKMELLLNDPELARRVAEAGHRRVMRDFSDARYVEQFHEMLVRLVGTRVQESRPGKATVEEHP